VTPFTTDYFQEPMHLVFLFVTTIRLIMTCKKNKDRITTLRLLHLCRQYKTIKSKLYNNLYVSISIMYGHMNEKAQGAG